MPTPPTHWRCATLLLNAAEATANVSGVPTGKQSWPSPACLGDGRCGRATRSRFGGGRLGNRGSAGRSAARSKRKISAAKTESSRSTGPLRRRTRRQQSTHSGAKASAQFGGVRAMCRASQNLRHRHTKRHTHHGLPRDCVSATSPHRIAHPESPERGSGRSWRVDSDRAPRRHRGVVAPRCCGRH